MDIQTDRTYVESSRDGALMVELDHNGAALRVQLEPEVNATWTAELLAERVLRLYTLALMRCRRDQLARMNERALVRPPATCTRPRPRWMPTGTATSTFEFVWPQHKSGGHRYAGQTGHRCTTHGGGDG